MLRNNSIKILRNYLKHKKWQVY